MTTLVAVATDTPCRRVRSRGRFAAAIRSDDSVSSPRRTTDTAPAVPARVQDQESGRQSPQSTPPATLLVDTDAVLEHVAVTDTTARATRYQHNTTRNLRMRRVVQLQARGNRLSHHSHQ